MTAEELYAQAKQHRKGRVAAILQSGNPHRLVVAGPGTGKTHLFKLLADNEKQVLTLSFVNSLIADLSVELYGRSDVRTLHGFGRAELARISAASVGVFPRLPEVIGRDSDILKGTSPSFYALFHNRETSDDAIEFYRERRNYYGYYGFPDIVDELVRHYEQDSEKIPLYDLVLVDEFQDFNPLEVALIELLGTKSPMLLVGDDDQALYEALKSASPQHIRERHSGDVGSYQPFTLPYCSRCTEVVVDAVNDLIGEAQSRDLLAARIDKPFVYYPCEKKDRESQASPRILFDHAFASMLPWFIAKHTVGFANAHRQEFSVLVLSRTRLQCIGIAEGLRSKGFLNVNCAVRTDHQDLDVLDGLRLLLSNKECRLGWRIAAEATLPKSRFEEVLEESSATENLEEAFSKFLDSSERSPIKKLLASLRKVDKSQDINDVALRELLSAAGIDELATAAEELRNSRLDKSDAIGMSMGVRQSRITVATFQGAKGLAADLVFIVNFDDQYCIRDKTVGVADQDVCSLLVSMTRARSRLHLVSTHPAKAEPEFLSWMSPERIEGI